MQVDAFGKIENCLDHFINTVKMDKDLSVVVYDNYSTNRRFNQRDQGEHRDQRYQRGGNYNRDDRNQNYSVNDGSSVNTFLSSQVAK